MIVEELKSKLLDKNIITEIPNIINEYYITQINDYLVDNKSNKMNTEYLLYILTISCNSTHIRLLINTKLITNILDSYVSGSSGSDSHSISNQTEDSLSLSNQTVDSNGNPTDSNIRLYLILILIKCNKISEFTINIQLLQLLSQSITYFTNPGSSDNGIDIEAAIEIIMYLSMIGTIKELFISDYELMNNLKLLITHITTKENTRENITREKENGRKINENAIVYGICCIFSNLIKFKPLLTEQQQQQLEIQRLTKSAPPEDEYDNESFVKQRINIFIEYNVLPILCAIKSSSINISNEISTIVLSVATIVQYRGSLVQYGCISWLLRHNSTTSTHALAKILISTNPTIALKYETLVGALKPLSQLLTDSTSSLVQFECMLALTNLASVNDDVRSRLLNLNILETVENMLLSSHNMLRRAATELACNMMYHPIVFSIYIENKNNRIQLVSALCDDPDLHTRNAASGILAILSVEKEAVDKLLVVPRINQIVISLLSSDDAGLVLRACELVKNIKMHRGAGSLNNEWVQQCILLQRKQGLHQAALQNINVILG